MTVEWYMVPAALFLDLAAGDPRFPPHPVVCMGKAIQYLEVHFRKISSNQVFCGAIFSLSLIGLAWLSAFAAVQFFFLIHSYAGKAVSIILLFYSLSAASLYKAAVAVKAALETGTLDRSREAVAKIVGRDVQSLDRNGVIRAAVETVAENFVDGVVSPLFFAVIGGVPLAVAYKMVNTLDSMVGYTSETYLNFGRASARIDDAANFIPARISVIIVALAAFLFRRRSGLDAFKRGFAEGRRHKSPNAGFPEAAFSAALGIKLGGPGRYHGEMVQKPYIGKDDQNPTPVKIKMACDLMLVSSILWGIVCMLASFCLGIWDVCV